MKSIQKQIDLLMNSPMSKKSDALLVKYEQKSLAPSFIDKLILEYQNGESTIELSRKYKIPVSTLHKKFKEKNVEMRERVRDSFHHQQKRQDILNGMSVKEYCEKYNDDRSSYYKFKRKLQKDLADTK